MDWYFLHICLTGFTHLFEKKVAGRECCLLLPSLVKVLDFAQEMMLITEVASFSRVDSAA